MKIIYYLAISAGIALWSCSTDDDPACDTILWENRDYVSSAHIYQTFDSVRVYRGPVLYPDSGGKVQTFQFIDKLSFFIHPVNFSYDSFASISGEGGLYFSGYYLKEHYQSEYDGTYIEPSCDPFEKMVVEKVKLTKIEKVKK